MPRVSYVNGRYLPHHRAAVHVEDRALQFADGVYEVIAVRGGRLVDEDAHLDRLARSLSELRMAPPMGEGGLRHVLREVRRRNRVRDGMLYLQVTRGTAPRDHAFPDRARPGLVVTGRSAKGPAPALVAGGCSVITVPDIRWRRCDIKSTALLPNVLAKQAACDAGAFEALQVDAEGMITEGTSTNAWIVTADGVLRTRAADAAILDGVTRRAVLRLAPEAGLDVEERPFSVDEAKAAAEVFLTSTTTFVLPVVRIDDATVGDGRPGRFTRRLLEAYTDYAAASGEPSA